MFFLTTKRHKKTDWNYIPDGLGNDQPEAAAARTIPSLFHFPLLVARLRGAAPKSGSGRPLVEMAMVYGCRRKWRCTFGSRVAHNACRKRGTCGEQSWLSEGGDEAGMCGKKGARRGRSGSRRLGFRFFRMGIFVCRCGLHGTIVRDINAGCGFSARLICVVSKKSFCRFNDNGKRGFPIDFL